MKETKFKQYSLKPFIIDAVEELGFYQPTVIQERIIPALLNGESAIGQSQTGTGKTHAYLLPILNRINPHKHEVQAVITAPTRELAQQIYDELQKITKHCQEEEVVSAKLIIGGTDRQRTIEKLKQQPHVVVGTPGRILDLMKDGALKAHTATALVIDEADLMLDLGFIKEVDHIAAAMPEKLQMLVFSATIPEKLKPFLKKYMANPKFTHVAPKQHAAENIEHLSIPVKHRDKFELLANVTSLINPYLAIVFTNTKKTADQVAVQLAERGISAGLMHGGLTPRERKKMMKELKDAKYQYVIATDLAARGIDIAGVSHVINFELPDDLDFYIHRVGRTARAGLSGTAITFYDEHDIEKLEKLEQRKVTFKNVDLKAEGFEEIGPRNKRKARKRINETEEILRTRVKKPKKVKPGYKKKMQQQAEQIHRREKRRNKKK